MKISRAAIRGANISMISETGRDISRLERQQLLDDYWKISKRRSGALVSTALRTRSTSMRDILVYGATGLVLDSETLKRRVLSGNFDEREVLDWIALADLGRLVILQNRLPDDQPYGAELLKMVFDSKQLDRLLEQHLLVLIQYLISTGEIEQTHTLLKRLLKIGRVEYDYLKADLLNPFTRGSSADLQEWLEYFNRMFIQNDLLPVSLKAYESKPFDRLRCAYEPRNWRHTKLLVLYQS